MAVVATGWIFLVSVDGNGIDSSPDARIFGKPSIIVLPFDNLSGDDGETYFSDGITDNLITDLSQISKLLVIARNTSFALRDREIDLRFVAEEFGVQYAVEGSVQKAGNRVRVNTTLMDARNGYQIWAARLDREEEKLFSLQDEITAQLIEALKIELTREERRAISKHYTESLEAYDLYLRAYEQYWQFNNESFAAARELLNEALILDPEFALAKSLLATTYTARNGATLFNEAVAFDRAYELARDAVALDPEIPQVHASIGLTHMFRREFDLAEQSFDRAIALDPSFADAYAMRSWSQGYAGKPEKALGGFEIAMRLNPLAPFPYFNAMAETHFTLGNYEKSIEINSEALKRNPSGQRMRLFLAAALALAGRIEDASWEIEELLILEPGLTLASVDQIAPYEDPERLARLIEGLRLAGLPE